MADALEAQAAAFAHLLELSGNDADAAFRKAVLSHKWSGPRRRLFSPKKTQALRLPSERANQHWQRFVAMIARRARR